MPTKLHWRACSPDHTVRVSCRAGGGGAPPLRAIAQRTRVPDACPWRSWPVCVLLLAGAVKGLSRPCLATEVWSCTCLGQTEHSPMDANPVPKCSQTLAICVANSPHQNQKHGQRRVRTWPSGIWRAFTYPETECICYKVLNMIIKLKFIRLCNII
jgi:hypothetical protein